MPPPQPPSSFARTAALLAAAVALVAVFFSPSPLSSSSSSSSSSSALGLFVAASHEGGNYGDVHLGAETIRRKIRERIKKQMDGKTFNDMPMPDPSSEDDQYYYFTLHDYNNDEHLDGHELRVVFSDMEALTDQGRSGRPDMNGKLAKDRLTLEKVEELIDSVLEEDDLDNDGAISWAEYVASQERRN
ncbi:hypothetical protein DFJ73DRAFT_760640 [Zopfochytrium polystomum]|nr:hypothetical protein DFJ73DRAFT_760640 [Zopfochytrium polystomum]